MGPLVVPCKSVSVVVPCKSVSVVVGDFGASFAVSGNGLCYEARNGVRAPRVRERCYIHPVLHRLGWDKRNVRRSAV